MEEQRLKSEMTSLESEVLCINGINIAFKGQISALDTKCINSIYDNKNTCKCIICGKTTKDFNDKNGVFTALSNDRLSHGIGVLHVKLRTMEALVKVAERLDVKQYKMSKALLVDKKKKMQKDLYETLGIRYGVVKQGFGSSNTGNMARVIFSHPKTFAETLNLPFELVKNLSIIMITISCLLPINLTAFKAFLEKTRLLWCEHFHWYPMPPTVHKLLAHGAEIAYSSSVTLGELSEEAGEAKHKDYRYVRTHLTRKSKRVHTNFDVFMDSWGSSDPVVSSYSHKRKTVRSPIPKEALDLLDVPIEDKRKLMLSDRYEWEETESISSNDDLSSDDDERDIDIEIDSDELDDLNSEYSQEMMDLS